MVLGLALRFWLIVKYPAVFGGDSILRLANTEHIVLSYQLPLLQGAIHYLQALSSDLAHLRYFVATVGAVAGAGFYALATTMMPRTEAFYAALLFVVNPFVLPLSTVPYQEILMLAGLFFAFYGVASDKLVLASVGLGAACLTRYEAWLACPVIAGVYLVQRGVSLRRVGEAAVLFGWAPIAWMLYSRGITPTGGYAVESRFSVARFERWAYLGYHTLRNLPVPAVLLVAAGAWQFSRRRLWRETRWQMLLAYGAVFLVAILFSAHGTDPDPERRVTVREIHVLLAGATLLAGLGLTILTAYKRTAVTVCALSGLWMSDRFLTQATSDPDLSVSFQTAMYLDSVVDSSQHVAVLAKPIVGIERYLNRLERRGGAAARAAGVRTLNHLDNSPPNYQRILVHSRLGKRHIHSFASLIAVTPSGPEVVMSRPALATAPDWVVRWGDFRPTSAVEALLDSLVAPLSPTRTISREGSSVSIYRVARK